MKHKGLTITLLTLFCVFVWIIGSEAAVDSISSCLVRLHIVANSDSESDQTVKLAVRDAVLAYIAELNVECNKEVFREHFDEITKITEMVLKKYNKDYECKISFEKCYFPTKQYENIILPAGEYDAVRILLGNAKGENWWCVMSPPLCFTNETRGEIKAQDLKKLEEGMGKENYALICDEENIKIKPAFKLVEWWQELKHAICG